VQLTVLGAGPAYTDRAGATGAAYLVRTDEQSILLDLGQGSFPAVAREIDPSSLSAVFISHLHPDHFIDLVPLRHYLRYEFTPPRHVPVYAPAGLAARIDALHAEPGFTEEVLDLHDLTPGSRVIGETQVEAGRVTHAAESYAFRISVGATALVYSGDCGRWQDLAPIVRRGDTLLVEVSFGTRPVPAGAFHLNAAAIVELVRATRPSRVLLTHIQMGFDREDTVRTIAGEFDGPVDLVDPGFAVNLTA
jgi:ribonuclease BN (tRNA processing enzyme)